MWPATATTTQLEKALKQSQQQAERFRKRMVRLLKGSASLVPITRPHDTFNVALTTVENRIDQLMLALLAMRV